MCRKISACHVFNSFTPLLGEMNAGNVATTGLPFNALPRKTNVRAPLILPPNQHDANEVGVHFCAFTMYFHYNLFFLQFLKKFVLFLNLT